MVGDVLQRHLALALVRTHLAKAEKAGQATIALPVAWVG
jgi:hypothetical protein